MRWERLFVTGAIVGRPRVAEDTAAAIASCRGLCCGNLPLVVERRGGLLRGGLDDPGHIEGRYEALSVSLSILPKILVEAKVIGVVKQELVLFA